MKRLFDALQQVAAVLAATLLASFTVIMIVDVICRYWLAISLAWTVELSILLFQWTAALGAALALRRGLHFGLGLVLPIEGDFARRMFNGFAGIVVSLSSLFLAVIAAQMVSRTWQSTYATLPLSHGVAYIGLLMGSVLMMLFGIEQFFFGKPAEELGG
jgi:TRAP-type C4-dicarboxylate transport system permease small subunit